GPSVPGTAGPRAGAGLLRGVHLLGPHGPVVGPGEVGPAVGAGTSADRERHLRPPPKGLPYREGNASAGGRGGPDAAGVVPGGAPVGGGTGALVGGGAGADDAVPALPARPCAGGRAAARGAGDRAAGSP